MNTVDISIPGNLISLLKFFSSKNSAKEKFARFTSTLCLTIKNKIFFKNFEQIYENPIEKITNVISNKYIHS